jgi:hypothetical protein
LKKQKDPLRHETYYTHAFVFKGPSRVMEEVKELILSSEATLIFQRHSLGKLFIKSEAELSGDYAAADDEQEPA